MQEINRDISLPDKFICDRCKKPTRSLMISVFNLQNICIDCSDEESDHPKYNEAISFLAKEESNGNMRSEGLGWNPDPEHGNEV